MPVITLQIGQGQTNEDQKARLVGRLVTDAADITGIPAEKFVTFIDEYPLEAIGIGQDHRGPAGGALIPALSEEMPGIRQPNVGQWFPG